jgi:hypothetical protein
MLKAWPIHVCPIGIQYLQYILKILNIYKNFLKKPIENVRWNKIYLQLNMVVKTHEADQLPRGPIIYAYLALGPWIIFYVVF